MSSFIDALFLLRSRWIFLGREKYAVLWWMIGTRGLVVWRVFERILFRSSAVPIYMFHLLLIFLIIFRSKDVSIAIWSRKIWCHGFRSWKGGTWIPQRLCTWWVIVYKAIGIHLGIPSFSPRDSCRKSSQVGPFSRQLWKSLKYSANTAVLRRGASSESCIRRLSLGLRML